MIRRGSGLLALALLAGCVHSGTKVERETGVDFSRLRRIGVMPFTDNLQQGRAMSESVAAGLRELGYDVADSKPLEKILRENKPDPEFGMSLATLVAIRAQTSADAILFGGVARDWKSATLTLVETEMGDPVMHAVLRPGDPKKAKFETTGDVVREVLRVFGAREASAQR